MNIQSVPLVCMVLHLIWINITSGKMSPEVVFTILYILISACVVYPPPECLSAGLTIESLFSNFLGVEHETFVTYHIKKSCLNLFIYSLLPLGYILSLCFLGYVDELTFLFTSYTLFWKVFATTGVVIPILSIYQIRNWCINNYEKHPIAINLTKFCNNNVNWRAVANDIDIEFRRVEKICIQTSAIIKVVATENWVLKVTPLTIFAIHQSDASLLVKEANTYQISYQNANETQYLNIEVKSSRRRVDPFIIRINAADFKDLKDRVARSIEILPEVKFHRSVLDQFVDVFKEIVSNNPLYDTNEVLDQCIGCLQSRPNIKIQKLCEDARENNCTSCYCRPMWCIDCIAKWFASRQEIEEQSSWLSSKCTCPMCRATFCMLDVCMLREQHAEE